MSKSIHRFDALQAAKAWSPPMETANGRASDLTEIFGEKHVSDCRK